MKYSYLLALACLGVTGASVAQAPVVDLNSDDLAKRLEVLERVVDSRTASQQRMQNQLNELQSDIDEIRGSIELHNHQLEKLLERQRELFLELDRRFEDLQTNSNAIAQDISNLDSSDSVSPSLVESNQPNAVDEKTMYQAAVDLILKDKDYQSAVPAFQQFLQSYPDSGLTANAHYWLGQLLYNQQSYKEAKEQFTQVVEKFTDSPKTPDSILKLGLIEKASGNLSAAEALFIRVLDEYPDSTVARLASQQLSN